MTRTLPLVVRCLCLIVLGVLLLPSLSLAMDNSLTDNLPGDTLNFRVSNCTESISVCIDSLPLTDAGNLSVSVNGMPYQGVLAGCNFDTISAYTYATLFGQGNSGPYDLTIWRVGDSVFSGIFRTIPDLVDSMNIWDPMGNWILDETAQLISGGEAGQVYSDMAVQVTSINTPSFIGYNFGIEAYGLTMSFGVGMHDVIILDTLNNTVRKAVVIVSCSGQQVVKGRILPNEIDRHCLDFSRLLGPVQRVDLFTAGNLENVSFQLVNNDSCIQFTGIQPGFDTTIAIACDAFGICDTTELIVETYDVPRFREATLNLREGTSQSYCLDTTNLVGQLTNFFDDCPTQNNTVAEATLDAAAYCVSIDGVVPGQDTTCLILCTEFGRCDTTILYITVHPTPTTETIALTITQGDSMEICPETQELAGLVTGIADLCENNGTETIISNINNVDLCFQLTANQVGEDSICAVICDNYLICDTTFYIITVVSSTPSLTATPDFDTTSINSPITIDVLRNDSVPDGTLNELEIIVPDGVQANGTTITSPDGNIQYSPNQDFCGTDEFEYRICNDANCDTATVQVVVTCATNNRELVIYTGFSPNGDGRNDFFKIDGIAQYPNNKLTVFNRWGTKVYEAQGYKNAWDGTWNKKLLPNGTYYYLLENGEGKQYSGFLYIQR